MSLTVLGFMVMAVLIGAVAALIVAGVQYEKKIAFVAAAVVAGFALAACFIGGYSLNNNIRSSMQSCVDKGGYVLNGKCLDRIPSELQRL